MRICVVTSAAANAEPRGPHHAAAAQEAFPDAEVIFLDLQPQGATTADPPVLTQAPGVRRLTARYPVRGAGGLAIAALAWRRFRVRLARAWFRLTGQITEALFGAPVIGLTARLKALQADLYYAHNIDTLLPAARAAMASGGSLAFDSMEYHADMGDSQAPEEARAVPILQARWLPRCVLVTAASEVLSDVLAREYGIAQPLALYNTPAVEADLPAPPDQGLSLYWRNSVVGFGQRGLDDVLVAMTQLPADVTLSVQGRPPFDGGAALARRVAELGLGDRVRVLPPYRPAEAVKLAAVHHVGLCLERRGPANHTYTVSNKLFDYMMGGLAVVVANLPGLKVIVDRSQGGLLFEPGSPGDLAAQIRRLHADPNLRAQLAANARAFALAEGNAGVDMQRFRTALKAAFPPRA
ncbi:glycosyltransferase involved in cell wall biosynthesis [Caulobacter ginsengisoli]|uniref:Glycosyltransferase involved in cell wall biosynthesis n=1 Tax=Caulobacter ginsengisoli TaxID=400775 RepID=A0ABU0IM81_9CAUL|nr:glycosyltransferase [Caulobacter ginsengisoli]MDQ0463115.1 glycosyltransferase involved in cell wall biosynthesis [Caulobacter ginsengisoli]